MQSHAQLARDAMMPWHRRSAMGVVVAILAATCLSAAALAQPCTPEWTSSQADLVGNLVYTPRVLTLAEFDPDLQGPLKREFFIGGDFGFAGLPGASNLARWDGFGWHDLGVNPHSGFPNNVLSEVLTLLVGPDVARENGRQALYALGGFNSIGGAFSQFVAKWDGAVWSGFGPLVPQLVAWAGTFHDFDGPDGPEPARLVVGGNFYDPSTQSSLAGAQYWNGSQWQGLGGPSVFSRNGLISFDADGDGPAPARLIGMRANSFGNGAIVEWDGSAWSVLRGSTSNSVSFQPFDTDGVGPMPASLFAAPESGPVLVLNADGSWSTEPISARCLAVADPDGPGPEPVGLYAAGKQGSQVIVWRRQSAGWTQFTTITTSAGNPLSMRWVDEDGSGPRPPSLFVGTETAGGIFRYGCPFNMPRCYGDADGSGLVEFNDVSLILARWGSRDQPGDIDRDGVVGMNDIVAVLASWGSPCEATRPAGVDPAAAWRDRGIEDFNDDGAVDFDDYTWAIANAGLDPRSPFGRANHTSEVQP